MWLVALGDAEWRYTEPRWDETTGDQGKGVTDGEHYSGGGDKPIGREGGDETHLRHQTRTRIQAATTTHTGTGKGPKNAKVKLPVSRTQE